MITVADLNGDGVNDMILGLSIPTVNGFEVADSVAWQWVSDMGIQMPGKDVGEHYMYTTLDTLRNRVRQNAQYKSFYLGKLTDEKYLTLRHRGYAFVMYGKKNTVPAVAEPALQLEKKESATTSFNGVDSNEPLTYRVNAKLWNKHNWVIDVVLKFKDGWHGFVDAKATTDQGMEPTSGTFELPDGLQAVSLTKPGNGGADIFYQGEIVFSLHVRESLKTIPGGGQASKPESYPININVSYQSCNDLICLPPTTHVIDYELKR